MAGTNIPSSASKSQHAPPLVLGIDGGGTKTLAWLARCDGPSATTTIGHGLAGPSNPQAVGCVTAQQSIVAAIAHAFAAARLPVAPVASACLALAGTGRAPIRQEMLDWAHGVPLAQQVRVVHDAQAVLAVGTSDGTGVAAICGTGSLAYGETTSGRNARAGGWGYLFGDEGSGYAIGRAALKAVARAADGRGRQTDLTQLLLAQLQLTEPAQLIPAIYDAPSPRSAIASLAPCVFLAADDRDDVAREIRRKSAAQVAQLVRSVAQRLGFHHHDYDLALAGGVMTRQPRWTELVVDSLHAIQFAPQRSSLVQDPVAGALMLANRARR